MEKRGISTIVATLLIVLITIAAATLIIKFTVPFVRDNLYKGTECVPYKDYFTFQQSEYNCYKSPKSGVVIKARTEGNQEIINNVASFKVSLRGDSSSVVVESSYLPKNGEFYTYSISPSFVPLSANVYPVLKSGKMCGVSDTIKILSCSASINLNDGAIIVIS